MYLLLDCETGGLDAQRNALLTLYAGVVSGNKIIDEQHWKIKHDGNREVHPRALAVNKINLAEHNTRALDADIVALDLNTMLRTHSTPEARLTPLGCNVGFDVGFIKAQLIPSGEWEKYVEHRVMDIQPVARFLLEGKLKSFSLDALCEYLQVKRKTAHDAREDALATCKIYKKLKAMVKVKAPA